MAAASGAASICAHSPAMAVDATTMNKLEGPYMDSSSFASNLLMAVGSTAYVYPAS